VVHVVEFLLLSQVVLARAQVVVVGLPVPVVLAPTNPHSRLGTDSGHTHRLGQVHQPVIGVCGMLSHLFQPVGLSCDEVVLAQEEFLYEQNHASCYPYHVGLYQYFRPYLNKQK
jgi:hypothetical protein